MVMTGRIAGRHRVFTIEDAPRLSVLGWKVESGKRYQGQARKKNLARKGKEARGKLELG